GVRERQVNAGGPDSGRAGRSTRRPPSASTIATRTLATLVALLACRGVAMATTVTGVVVDHRGQPVELANVVVASLKRGAVTDAQGRFRLELPDTSLVLEASQLGYQRTRLAVVVTPDRAPVRFVLAEEPVPVAEVVVRTSSFGKIGKAEGATLRRMDVVMTPGGAADVFQSLRALPSINAPNEGAAVYVRGGDPY